MSPRLPVLFALCLAAATAARAGAIEDLFRGLIDRHKAEGKTILARPLGLMAKEITQPEVMPRNDGLMLGERQIAVFVAPGCRTCVTATERLRKRGWKFEELNIGTSSTAREAFELAGAKGVPTVLLGRHMMAGYSDRMFDRLLKTDIQRTIQQQQGTGN